MSRPACTNPGPVTTARINPRHTNTRHTSPSLGCPAGAVLALVSAIVLLVAAAQVNHAAAQTDGRIDLVAQTAFVGDTPATIDLRLSAPAGSTIRIQIFEALTNREDIRSSYRGLGDRRPFSDFSCDVDEPPETAPCQLNSTGEIFSIEIPDQEIGEILRVNQGALPVVVTLHDNNGDVIDTLITHLLVLDDQQDPTLHIAFLADLSTPLALQPDQTIQLDTQDLFERAQRIAQRRQVPITVALQPETLQALAVSEPDRLNEFIELLADRPVLNAPWVDLDEEAWRLADDINLITDHYSHGAAVITEILGRAPSAISRIDRNTTPETLAVLAGNGTETAVVEADRISVTPAGTSGLSPVQLDATNGETMTAIAIDASLRQTLNHPDAELAGQRALTELAIAATNATTDSAILFDFDQLESAVLDVLLEGIQARSNLQTSEVARALQVPAARNAEGRTLQVTLAPTPTPDLSQRSADIGVTRGTVDAYASMIAPERTPITPLETLMRAAAASRLSEQQSAAYTRSVFEVVLTGTADITIEPSERITLTDRHADLRITVRNGQPLPITVEFLLSAEKLRFVDGERFTRTLNPGDNEVLVRVETLASGDARVTVNITSPGGQLEITEGVVDIRSTAISGLGLVISIIALVVLGGWWARTIRRVRRNRAAATVADTAAATVADTAAATRPPDSPHTEQHGPDQPHPNTASVAPSPDPDQPHPEQTNPAPRNPDPDQPDQPHPEQTNPAPRNPDPDQPDQPHPEQTNPAPRNPDPDKQDQPHIEQTDLDSGQPHPEQPEPDPKQPDQPQQDQEEL